MTLNLNTGEYEGGALRFPEFGRRTYQPPAGGATVFSCALLHEATPVTKGTRYAFVPFLYDEVGAKLRRGQSRPRRRDADRQPARAPGEPAALGPARSPQSGSLAAPIRQHFAGSDRRSGVDQHEDVVGADQRRFPPRSSRR